MTLWFTARGAGLAAVLVLTLAVSAGAVAPLLRSNRLTVQYVHRAASLLGLALVSVHVSAIVADAQAHVGLVGALVPFASGYRPGSVALGSLAAYGLLLTAALGLARGRLAQSPAAAAAWRAAHSLAYGVWAVAMLHGLFTGTDADLPWVRALFLGCCLAGAAAVTTRFVAGPGPRFAGARP